jgi:hypothetical protein
MPLKSGKKNIGKNISELMDKGHSRAQSIAIALQEAKKKKKKKGKK